MKPPERFEFWTDWKQWGIALVIDTRFRRVWGIIGPFNAGFNWSIK